MEAKEEYRLDSHMWSLYHNDLKGLNLVYSINREIICGPIVAKEIKNKNIENLEELQQLMFICV